MAASLDYHQQILQGCKSELEERKKQDTSKYILFENLFAQVAALIGQLQDKESELKEAKDLKVYYCSMIRDSEVIARDSQSKLQELQQQMACNAFVSVLIDGDCMPFIDELVQEGSNGGHEAARLLKQAMTDYLKAVSPNMSHNVKIVFRVYANTKGLAQTYKDSGILSDVTTFEEFVRGFNMENPLCDFVDAGTGKECTDEKLKEIFKLHVADAQCQHVLFGGSPDNGYARLLTPYSSDLHYAGQITLLEGPPFARELAELKVKFHTTSFETIFRTSKLPTRRRSFNMTPPASPAPNYASAAAQGLPARPKSTVPTPPQLPAQTHGTMILRNKQGQRIDSSLKYWQSDVTELKPKKLCNQFHLLGRCSFIECEHPHTPKLNERQLAALRFIARLSPCGRGLECDDPLCISGHRCPREPCTVDKCRFPRQMHGVDKTVV